jgi:hypothetical protein
MKRENVSLDLNEVLLECAEKELNQHGLNNPQSPFDIICDLPKLCRDLCMVILRYLWRNNCKGYKTKTAEICCIHRDSVRNYENYIEP